MPQLPKAILFDLDDTIIAAYGRPELAWTAVIGEFADEIAPLPQTIVVKAIGAASVAFWGDPERHRVWRQKLRLSRREIVADGFARLAEQCHAVPDRALQHRIADRF